MTEYITREAMLAAIQDWDDGTNMDIFTNEVREIIEAVPAVDKVVRCKNCIHFGREREAGCGVYNCTHLEGMVDAREDGFCSCGEERRI